MTANRMSAHTPGPWSVSGVRRKWYQAEDIKHVCDSHAICTNDGEAIALVLYDPKQHLPCWNDARLIAAAPDLLAALEMLAKFPLEEFGVTDADARLWKANEWQLKAAHVLAARAAIAKATGESA